VVGRHPIGGPGEQLPVTTPGAMLFQVPASGDSVRLKVSVTGSSASCSVIVATA
jgi:hypothetical protein